MGERNDLIEQLKATREIWKSGGSAYAEFLLPVIDQMEDDAATIASLSEALAEAEKKGAEDGVAKCLEHIAYVRANIRMNPTDRVRFSVGDLNFAFRSALDVLKERITGEDEGEWQPIEDAAPPRDLSQGGQHG